MTQAPVIRIQDTDDRLHVRLNRPEVRNAIDQATVDQLNEVCAELEDTPRILIISGAPGVFASGADIGELRQRGVDHALRGINSRVFARIARLPMPVIALLDGWALGGGAELAFAADFRVATPRTKLGNPETSLGIVPAAGALWRLKELVGEPLAKEVILTGRVLTADEALECHLVNRVVDPDGLDQAGGEIADAVAAQDPLAVRLAKAVFHAPPSAHPVIDEVAQAVCFTSPAKHERMAQFLERKKK
jgi:enoyl-CoA hydratase